MSERKIRGYAWHHRWCKAIRSTKEAPCDCGYWQAKQEDPDLVGLLQILKDAEKEHERQLDDDDPPTWEQGYEYGFYDAAVSFIYEIEKTVRLTDDGWEWTEEGSDATE